MANIVITTSGNSIIVDFGDYYDPDTRVEFQKASFDSRKVFEVHLHSDHVSVTMEAEPLEFELNYTTGVGMIVDSVAGVAPTSLSDLFDKITALRG